MQFKLFGHSCRLELLILALVIGWIMGAYLLCSCSTVSMKEGLNMLGSNLDYRMGNGVKPSWEKDNKDYNYNKWFNNLEANTGGEVPLPKGELYMFYKNKFDGDCCPSTYSSSTGCACVSPEQMNDNLEK